MLDLARVPGADDVAATVGVVFQVVDDFGELVDTAAVGRTPVAPLRAVDATKVAIVVGPLIPDRDLVLVEILDVGLALDEPQQLVNDRAQMQLLGGQ